MIMLYPLAMSLYAFQPLITSLQAASSVKQCCFADDASGAGSIMEIRTWWYALSTLGPDFAFFAFSERQEMLDHRKTS